MTKIGLFIICFSFPYLLFSQTNYGEIFGLDFNQIPDSTFTSYKFGDFENGLHKEINNKYFTDIYVVELSVSNKLIVLNKPYFYDSVYVLELIELLFYIYGETDEGKNSLSEMDKFLIANDLGPVLSWDFDDGVSTTFLCNPEPKKDTSIRGVSLMYLNIPPKCDDFSIETP